MHVVVVGCGRVGSGLAAHPRGRRPHRGRHRQAGQGVPAAARGVLAAAPSRGSASTGTCLREAGIEEAGALAAVTSGDNSNIMVARTAREVFGLERVIARIYDPRRAAIYEKLGIPTIATVQWTTDRVLRRILPDAPATEWTDPSAGVVLVERPVAAELGRPPARRPRRRRAWPGSRRCPGSASAQVPAPDLVTQEGDVVYVTVGGRPPRRARRPPRRRRRTGATREGRHRRRRQRRHLHRRRAHPGRPRGDDHRARGRPRGAGQGHRRAGRRALGARRRLRGRQPPQGARSTASTCSPPSPATTRTTSWCRCSPSRSSRCPA